MKRVIASVFLLGILLACVPNLGGCRALIVDSHGRVYIDVQPPPVRVEVRPARPKGRRWVWVDGHWARRHGRWEWVPGYWKKIPRRHRTWVRGHWEHDAYGWYWVEGHWQ